MKMPGLLLTLSLLAGCSSPSGDVNAPATSSPATAPDSVAPPMPTPASTAVAARGVVEAVDVAAKTVTIAHDPVEALKWPAMTMTFRAPNADLGGLKQGDHIVFEFTSSGMDGTITTITRQ